MGKWTGLEKPITAAAAEAEHLRLFGPSYEARQRRLAPEGSTINRATYRPWEKPEIERVKR